MEDGDKTREQLISELEELRTQVTKLKVSETEHKQQEAELKRSEERYHSLIEHANDAIISADREGNIVTFNKKAEEIYGYSRDEILGKSILLLVPEEYRGQQASASEVFKTNSELNTDGKTYEMKGLMKDSREVDLEFSFYASDVNRERVATAIIRDITERKKKEKEIRESRDFLEKVFKTSADGIMVTDAQGLITMTNNVATKMLGYSQNELIGKHPFEITLKENENVEKGKEFITKLFEEGVVTGFEHTLSKKDGSLIEVERSAALLKDNKGNITGAVTGIRDITGRKRAEEALREREEFSASLLGNAPNPILVINPDTSVRYINPALEELTGFSSADVIGRGAPYPWWTEETLQKTSRDLKEAMQRGAYKLEKLFRKKDGKKFWVELTSTPVKSNGKLKYYLANWVDITERKQAEEEIQSRVHQQAALAELGRHALAGTDLSKLLDEAVATVAEVLRVEYCKVLELLPSGDALLLRAGVGWKEGLVGRATVSAGADSQAGYTLLSSEPVIVQDLRTETRFNGPPLLLDHGVVSGMSVIIMGREQHFGVMGMHTTQRRSFTWDDIHFLQSVANVIAEAIERKRVEEALRNSEERYHNLIEFANVGIIVTEGETITHVNKEAEEIYDYSREELIGQPIDILTPEKIRRLHRESLGEIITSGKMKKATFEQEGIKKDGTVFPAEISFSLAQLGEDTIITVVRDITKRKKAEREIKEAKNFLVSIIEGSTDGIIITDGEGYILSVNSALERMSRFKKEELMGKHASVLMMEDKDVRTEIRQRMEALLGKGFTSYESRHRTREGKIINVECNASMINDDAGNNIAGVTIVRDITDRKAMEHKLLQSEKLKSLGELAAGVAHDFNNVLAAVMGNAQLLKMDIDTPPGVQERRKSVKELEKGLDIVVRAAKDGAETVRRIQEFARRRDDDRYLALVNINEVVENSLDFTRAKWKDDAESKGIVIGIQKELSPLPLTAGSAAELREVFTNLIINAVDAMPQGGTVSLKTFKDGDSIFVKVKDTGLGISPSLRDRIFDPFFTTKGVRSTGLGLSVSYGIINSHHGTITVESRESEGTTFTVEFPISERTIVKEKEEAMAGEQRKARVLVIEDEEQVRTLLSSILTKAGHEIEIAVNGREGIEMFERKEFDLVFTDLGMPGMSGWKLAERIKSINKKMPVVLITGWDINLKELDTGEKNIDLIIHKPFDMRKVLNTVQEGMVLKDRFHKAL